MGEEKEEAVVRTVRENKEKFARARKYVEEE